MEDYTSTTNSAILRQKFYVVLYSLNGSKGWVNIPGYSARDARSRFRDLHAADNVQILDVSPLDNTLFYGDFTAE